VHELRRAGLSAEVGQKITVRYENVIVGDFIADLIVNESLIVELKATVALTKTDEVQLVNYLTATNRDFGLLFNFGTQSLQFKRKHRRSAADAGQVDLQNPVNQVNPV
jgi:GxxExxY protein